jgi:hypothetical protein
MIAALLGSLSCARCAQIVPADWLFCATCGFRQLPAAGGGDLSPTNALLAGVVQVTAPRLRLAFVIDMMALLVVAAVFAGAGAKLGPGPTPDVILLAVSGVVIAGVIQLVTLRNSGRTLGLRLFDLRLVDDLTALPPSVASALRAGLARSRPRPQPRSSITADLRRGRDPLSPAHAPVVLAGRQVATGLDPTAVDCPSAAGARDDAEAGFQHAAAHRDSTDPDGRRRCPRSAGATLASAPAPARAPAPTPATKTARPTFASARLIFDSGDEVTITHPLLVGRNPETDASGTAVRALPDLSRSMSRTHALLEWREGLLWVTDLNTTNGTAIVDADGGVRPVIPGLRTSASIGGRVELGERSLEIHPGAPA